MRRNWIIALGLFALVIVGIVSLQNERNSIQSSLNATLAQSIANPDVELSGATFKEIVRGVTYWELHAKKSDVNEDAQTAKLRGTRGTFFEKGEPFIFSSSKNKNLPPSKAGIGNKFNIAKFREMKPMNWKR
jgi:hypothetical protein